jgi:hypothetical protein
MRQWANAGRTIALCTGLVSILAVGLLFLQRAIVLEGDVDEAMRRKAEWVIHVPGPVYVDTGGGNADQAWAIAKMIRGHGKNLQILGECTSACAEYFIPAAKRVYVTKQSLIGYHQNDHLDDVYVTRAPERIIVCDAERRDWLKVLYRERGLNSDFYQMTMEKLGTEMLYLESMVKREPYNNCIEPAFAHHTAEIWFPTSRQLKENLGLKIDGPICADDEQCWKRRLEEEAAPPQPRVVGSGKYVVGDVIYTVQAY